MSSAGPAPKVGTFLVTKRTLVSFLWATAWFLILFLGMLSYELTSFDPLALGVPIEPDGINGLRWWRLSVSRVMLTVMRRASDSVPSADTAATKQATASQSLLTLRASYPKTLADPNMPRTVWRAIAVPRVGSLSGINRMLTAALGDEEDAVEAAADGVYDRHGGGGGGRTHHRSRMRFRGHGDVRMPEQCGMFLHVDASALRLGAAASGGFSTKDGSFSVFGSATEETHRLLFESFVYCGNRRDTPSTISRRIQEYFQSCPAAAAAAAASSLDGGRRHHNNENNHQSSAVTCVSPGMFLLHLLHRRITTLPQQQRNMRDGGGAGGGGGADDAAAPSMENTRTIFLDIGAGSEIMSTIAVSAMHGYRQSARLTRGAMFSQQQNKPSARLQDLNDPVVTEAVIAPPAIVVPIEMSSEYDSPLEATRVCDSVPSNSKLFYSREQQGRNHRHDCHFADPDRVVTMPMNIAVGLDPAAYTGEPDVSGMQALEPSTFYTMRTHRAKRDAAEAAFVTPPTVFEQNEQQWQQSSLLSSTELFSTSPRIFQCFVKEEIPQSSFLGKSDASKNLVADTLAANGIREQLRGDNNGEDHSPASVVDKKKRKVARLARLPTSKQWQQITDSDWATRLMPHIDDPRPIDEQRRDARAQTLKSLYPSHRGHRTATEHYIKMHPTPLSTVMDQVTTMVKGTPEPELTGSRATQHNTFVGFADVGGHDTNYLDCGLAVSQAELAETIADAAFDRGNVGGAAPSSNQQQQHQPSLSSPSSVPALEVVMVLRPINVHSSASSPLAAESDSVAAGKGEFSGWCSGCSVERARHIADETVAALERAKAVIISGCDGDEPSPSGGGGVNFLPITKEGSVLHTVRSYLLHLVDSDTLPGDAGGAPFCAVWISSTATDQHNPRSQTAPTAEEMSELRMSVLERVDDDAKAGLVQTERRAVARGLSVASNGGAPDRSSLDGGDAAAGGGAENEPLEAHSASSASSSSWLTPKGIGLLLVAFFVAFFLIRGVCKNFASAKKAPKKDN